MGPLKQTSFAGFKDAAWNEKLASITLLAGIFIIGIAPFLLTGLISTDSHAIMININRITDVVLK
jgi:NADH:ubiquinone oxidoreductase subunit 4 (subunit M)